jgi:hypothetical protein
VSNNLLARPCPTAVGSAPARGRDPPADLLRPMTWPRGVSSCRSIHFPDFDALAGKRRLVFEELFTLPPAWPCCASAAAGGRAHLSGRDPADFLLCCPFAPRRPSGGHPSAPPSDLGTAHEPAVQGYVGSGRRRWPRPVPGWPSAGGGRRP